LSTSETMSNEGMTLSFGFQIPNFKSAEQEIPITDWPPRF
jgi:hypothetical protein